MALSGLDIYKHLPKTNCKECGFPTCLAFAMQLAAKKVDLKKCPHITEASKAALESASRPPIKLITLGADEEKLEVGNETVMFRHEETFYHPTGIGFLVEDTEDPKVVDEKLSQINKLKFERVGQEIKVNLVALKCASGNKDTFLNLAKKVVSSSKLALVFIGDNPDTLKEALVATRERRPLIYAATKDNSEKMFALAKELSLPLVIKADSLEGLDELAQKAVAQGIKDLVLDSGSGSLSAWINNLTQIR